MSEPSAMVRAAAAIAKIGAAKDMKNAEQNYRYRSTEGILNLVAPVLADVGLSIEAQYDLVSFDDYVTAKGTRGKHAVVKGRFRFHAGGETRETIVLGEGKDLADKALAKAQTYAMKTALIATFCIPFIARPDDSEQSTEGTEGVAPRPDPAMALIKGRAPAETIDPETGEVKVVEPPRDGRDAFGLPPSPPLDRAYFEATFRSYWDAKDRGALNAWYRATTDDGRAIIRDLIEAEKAKGTEGGEAADR